MELESEPRQIPNYFQNWEPNERFFIKKILKTKNRPTLEPTRRCQPGKCVTLCDHMHADRAPGKSTRILFFIHLYLCILYLFCILFYFISLVKEEAILAFKTQRKKLNK